ncbi:hypothetical protein FSP39_013306 [Pinctada imbricata]|uniref:Ubiquitin-like protease family profile domain-containing protein n=1 Tax=Pinctada imbricata TaxID=66713 RepID=A0AA89C7A8_PINIB|nr:hypothetical protein FSP39_013306 [Pinctada imbricata]
MFPADASSSTSGENIVETTETMDVTEAVCTVTQNVVQITPSVVQITPSEVQITPSVVQITPNVLQATPTVVQATRNVVQATPNIVQATPNVVQATPSVVQATPSVVQATPNIMQAAPNVVQATPNVVQATPSVVQTTPSVVQTTPSVLQQVASVVQPTHNRVQTASSGVQATQETQSVTGNLEQQVVSSPQKNTKARLRLQITHDGKILTEAGQNVPLTPQIRQLFQNGLVNVINTNSPDSVSNTVQQSPMKINGSSAVTKSGGQKVVGIAPNILRTSGQNMIPAVTPSVVLMPQTSNAVVKTPVINTSTISAKITSTVPTLPPQQKLSGMNIASNTPMVNQLTGQTVQPASGQKFFIIRSSAPGVNSRADVINQPKLLASNQQLKNIGVRQRKNPKSHEKIFSYYAPEGNTSMSTSDLSQISVNALPNQVVSKNEKIQNIQVVYQPSLQATPSQSLTPTQTAIKHSLPKSITVGATSQSNREPAAQTIILHTGDVQEESRLSYNDLTKNPNQVFQKYVGSANVITPKKTKRSPPSKLQTLISAPLHNTQAVLSMQASSQESLLTRSLLSNTLVTSPQKNIPRQQEAKAAITLPPTVSTMNISPATLTVTPSDSSSSAVSQPLVATVLCSYNDPTIDSSQLQNLSQLSQLSQSTGVISSQNSTVSLESQNHSESENSNSASDVEPSESMLKEFSMDQVEILHNLKLKKNTVCKVPIKGKDYYVIFDGKNLVPYSEPETKVVTPVANTTAGGNLQLKPVILGGGLENKKLKGNATGLNMAPQDKTESSVRELLMKTKTTTTKFVPISQATVSGTVNVQNGRVWKHSSGPQANLTRRPIHAVTPIQKESSVEIVGVDNPSSSEPSNAAEEKAAPKTAQKRPATEEPEEDCIVHCRYCGYSSSNIKECDRCGRIFPRNVKITKIKRKKTAEVKNSDKDAAISKQSFYGQKLNEQSAPYQKSDAMENYVKQKQGFGRPITVSGKTHRTPNTKLVKVKKIVPAEPVEIILSSDDEEESSHSTNQHEVPVSLPVSTATGTVVTIQMAKVNKDISDELGDLVNVLPRTTSPTFPGSRIRRMEDEKGNIATTKNQGKRSRPNSRAENPTSTLLPENPIPSSVSTESGEDKTEVPSTITFKAKNINIGSLKSIPIDPVMLSSDGIDMYIECEEDTFRINIPQEDIQRFCLCFEMQRLMLIHTTADFGKRLRLKLGMTEKEEGKPYFDPDDSDGKYQYIMIDSMKSIGSEELTSFLQQKYASDKRNPQTDFVYTMTESECNNILNQSLQQSSDSADGTSGEVTPAQSEMERSPSPPKFMFVGPVKKLITFPPPPERGGIQVTNEDLFCLQEGEFLNDVIIDFYLKYLYLKVLSEEDRKRTHIFSSFFFKRLTLRQGRGSSVNETPDMTPAEKKHARVKTWTKHVDLFEKDFIIVPINEHSHWFLAIICYPGINGITRHKYFPKKRPLVINPILERKDGTKFVHALVVRDKISPNSVTMQSIKCLQGYKIPKKGEKAAETPKEDAESKKEDSESKTENDESGKNGKMEEKDENETTEESDESQKEMEVDQGDKSELSEKVATRKSTRRKTSESLLLIQAYSNDSNDSKKEAMETDENDDKASENKQMEVDEPAIPVTIQATPIKNAGKEICGRPLTKEEEEHPPKGCLDGQKQPCILVLDSLAGQSRTRIVNILKEYLQVEWDVKKKTPNILKEKMRGSSPRVPQQTNYSDCGVYVLQYVESFFEDPIQDFSIPLRPLSNWFTAEKVGKKRAEIESIIMQLKEEQENPKGT